MKWIIAPPGSLRELTIFPPLVDPDAKAGLSPVHGFAVGRAMRAGSVVSAVAVGSELYALAAQDVGDAEHQTSPLITYRGSRFARQSPMSPSAGPIA